jgi:beta-mannosidase
VFVYKGLRPEPFKFIKFPDRKAVELNTTKPIKGLVLEVEGEDAVWSDQAIDLVPDDPQVVKVKGLKGREVHTRFLGDGSA